MVMAYYYLVLDKPYSSQRCWALIGISVKVSQAVRYSLFTAPVDIPINVFFNAHTRLAFVSCLWIWRSSYLPAKTCADRDSAWWNRNPADVQRRRDVFWELFSFETLQVCNTVHPSNLVLRSLLIATRHISV